MKIMIDLLGKFHPLLLHLPIGILIYAYIHFTYDFFLGDKRKKVDFGFALLLGSITSVFAAISGFLLASNGEYEGELLQWHKWLGIATAIGAILIYIIYKSGLKRKMFLLCFTIFMGILTAAGHYGGSLTHGEGLLSPNASIKEKSIARVENIDEASVFHDIIFPIVDRKCVSCHNPKKKKGELLMHTIEGWERGGESGSLLLPGNVEGSLITQRIHLPKEEKEHMPPTGKKQLDIDEMKIMDWWVSNMTTYTHLLSELDPPEDIRSIIENRLSGIDEEISKANASDIEDLQNLGFIVNQRSEGKPWLNLELQNGREIGKKEFKALKRISNQAKSIDLAGTPIKDNLLKFIDEFNQLESLNLSRTGISSKAIRKMGSLPRLKSLNLYGTKMNKSIFELIEKFPNLKNLFLWQSGVEKEDLAEAYLQKDIEIFFGQSLDGFERLKLIAPEFITTKTLFRDSLKVIVENKSLRGELRYTLDGSTPDGNSPLLDGALYLNETKTISTIVTLPGWESSEVMMKTYHKISTEIAKVEVKPQPNEKYSEGGNLALIDFQRGSNTFGDGKWLGFQQEDVVVSLDLGDEQMVHSISFGTLRDDRSYIFAPLASKIEVSIDGVEYKQVAQSKYTQIKEPQEADIKAFIEKIDPIVAKYVKVSITAQKKNPEWHAAPGASCWLFLDEFIIN